MSILEYTVTVDMPVSQPWATS